jgi:3-oxoacyl-[acyl-carrier-protein] synthase-3
MFAIKKTVRVLKRIRAEFETPDRTLHFVGHQANLTMLDAVCSRCEIDPERHHHNVIDFGNTGAAGAPSVVSMRWDEWGERDDVAVVGVGSGLTWSGHLLRFGAAG